jgi:hypothetical protein
MDMKKREEYLSFVSYEDFKNQAEVWYKAYNIIREKTEVFHDFIVSLYDLVEKTYMGSDATITELDKKNHFTWCWNKVIDNFSKESIYFKETGQHYEYMWVFFNEAYYLNETGPNRIREYFDKLFQFDYRKTRSELDMLTEFYKILDHNLKK